MASNEKTVMILSNDTTYTFNLRDVLIKEMIDAGYNVIIACEHLKKINELKQLGVRLLDQDMGRHSKSPLHDLRLYSQLKKILEKEKPDVVLTYNIKPCVYGGMACKKLRIPYITTITGLGTAVENGGIISKISKMLYRFGNSKASYVLFQNNRIKRFFETNKLLGKRSNVKIIPGSGVNLSRFGYHEYPAEKSQIILSYIGRIMKDKGTDELLDAISIVKEHHSDVAFRLIGYFDDDYQDKVREAEGKGNVEHINEQDDIIPFLSESWAVIQPSHHEGMSNVLLESAAIGRPVIASAINGCIETFDEGVSGFSFPVGDAQKLADIINKFIELPHAEKRKMGEAGRKKMESEFDRRIIANQYIKIIREIEGA